MLKRIAVTELCLGMYIHEFCGSWMDHPFWRGRFLLDNERDLQRVLDSEVHEVWIDVSKGLDVAAGQASQTVEEVEAETEARLQAVAESRTPPPRASLDDEVQRALKLCAQSKAAVVQMFSDCLLYTSDAADE